MRAKALELLQSGIVGTSVNDGPVAMSCDGNVHRFDVAVFDRLAVEGYTSRDSISSGRAVLYHWRWTGKED